MGEREISQILYQKYNCRQKIGVPEQALGLFPDWLWEVSHHFIHLFVSPAQLLQTVSEDNFPAVQEICSSPQHLSQLESLLQEAPPSDKPNAKSSQLLLRTCIAGNEHQQQNTYYVAVASNN